MSSTHIRKISHSYSLYVAKNRAIPSVIDGLKHGQRMALWVLRNKSSRVKTMALTGELMAEKIYVHGDSSANNTISLLAAPFKNNAPLVQGHGFFGSRVAPGEFGAARYTEVSRAKTAQLFLYNDLELVPLAENYDGSTMEPIHFLPLIPVVLLNGISGVAVGWSTEILPRKLKGVIDATLDALGGKKKLRGLLPNFENYDLAVIELGGNKYELQGKAEITDTSTVTITELPPSLGLDTFKKKLIELEEVGQISDFEDHSSKTIKIVVKFPRGHVKGWSSDDAIKFFKLTEKISERIVTIDWSGNGIQTYDDASYLVKDFVKWRLGWYTRRFEKLWEDDSAELTYWRILKLLFEAGFPKKLGTFADRTAMEAAIKTEIDTALKKPALSKLRVLMREDDRAINRVVNLPTYRWTAEFKAEVDATITKLEGNLADYAAILESPERLKKVYSDELEDLKKKIG